MIIGAHNTMTYRSPKQWYLKPFSFIARCQRMDYKTLHEKYNVDVFDLRIFYDKSQNIEFRHGCFRYDASDLCEILDYCNKNKMYVRFLFEYRKTTEERKDLEELIENFKRLCQNVENKYKDIKFYGGYITETEVVIYDFKNKINEIGFYSSVTSLFGKDDISWTRYLDDWWPWLYARLKNKTNMKENATTYKDKDICILYDFNDIQ